MSLQLYLFLNRFRVFQTSKGPFLYMHAFGGFFIAYIESETVVSFTEI